MREILRIRNRAVEVTYIGSGGDSEAYLGDGGTVYLFVDKECCITKDIMTKVQMPHLPDIMYLETGTNHEVYILPYYRKVNRSSEWAMWQLRWERVWSNIATENALYGLVTPDKVLDCMVIALEQLETPQAIVDALVTLGERLLPYPTHYPDFQLENMGLDANNEIVFFDPFTRV